MGGTISEGSGYHSPGMQGIVDTIRTTGANNVIAVGGINYASNLSGIAAGYAISGTNILYSVHVYPFGDVTWDQNVTVVQTAGIGPVLVGEYGADIDDEYADFYARMLPWIRLHNYSNIAWSLNTTYKPCLISDWNYTRTLHGGAYVLNSINNGPLFPTGLLASGGDGSITLSWNSVAGATSYSIYRANTPQTELNRAPIARGIAGTKYTDTGLTNGTVYFYQVDAVNAAQPMMESGPSNESSAFAGTTGRFRIIYDDQLRSGYYNYSYASIVDPTNIAPIHSGKASIKVIYSAAGQGVLFRASEFSCSPYNTLTFWVNGGATGGQTVNVYADIEGTKSTAVTIGPMRVNAWTQENIPFSSLGIAGSTRLDGFHFGTPNGAQAAFYIDDIYLSGATVAPAAPESLKAVAGNGIVVLKWPMSSSHDPSYRVYGGTRPGGEGAMPLVMGIGTTSNTDTGLTNGVTYYYKIAVTTSGGTSVLSPEVAAIPSRDVSRGGLPSLVESESWTPAAGTHAPCGRLFQDYRADAKTR